MSDRKEIKEKQEADSLEMEGVKPTKDDECKNELIAKDLLEMPSDEINSIYSFGKKYRINHHSMGGFEDHQNLIAKLSIHLVH